MRLFWLVFIAVISSVIARAQECPGCELDVGLGFWAELHTFEDEEGNWVGAANKITTIHSDVSGACAIEALPPPYHHLSSCKQFLPCWFWVKTTISMTGAEGELPVISDVLFEGEASGTICNEGHPNGKFEGPAQELVLFDAPIRLSCGSSCEIDSQIKVEAYAIRNPGTEHRFKVSYGEHVFSDEDIPILCTACDITISPF